MGGGVSGWVSECMRGCMRAWVVGMLGEWGGLGWGGWVGWGG